MNNSTKQRQGGIPSVFEHDDDHHDDSHRSEDSFEVHPLVEQTIAEGKKRRLSRHSFCLTGDIVIDTKDVLAVLNYVDTTPFIARLVFVQTMFTMESMNLFARYLESPRTTRIRKLIFSSVLLRDDIVSRLFQGISKNRSLQELVFHDCCFDLDAKIDRELSTNLPQNPKLRSLNLTSNGSTDMGLFHITNALRNITELNLSDCELNCGKALLLFHGLRLTKNSLRSLDLSNNDIRASGLRAIAKFLANLGTFDTHNNGELDSLSLAGNTRLFDN